MVFFDKAEFNDYSNFDDVRFSGSRARFGGAHFREAASFRQAKFSGWTEFSQTEFHADADFRSVQADRGNFSLAGANFTEVPDFTQAHFVKAPRLDNVKIPTRGSSSNNRDDVARYRNLRQLAVQGHDQERERMFLAAETRLRRLQETWWDLSFWLGIAYEYLSDFGRSISIPFWWWVGSIVCFALIYFMLIFFGVCGMDIITSSLSALYFSTKSAILMISLDSSTDKLDIIKAVDDCLNEQTKYSLWLALLIITLQIIQKVFSAALLFLFILALRNKFKIS